jgi:hypothetical protein
VSTAEPSINDLSPITKTETEPMLLLDTTGSMSFPAAEGSSTERRQVVHEAIGRIVEVLEAKDSQEAAERAGGDTDKGGVMTVTFADGNANLLDDLSTDNLVTKWNSIRWGGGTVIMPGWNMLVDTYMEEFGDQPKTERPAMLALVITDGEADDTNEFASTLAQAKGGTYVAVAIVGYGAEHDRALAAYQQIAAANEHVRVLTFAGETDPNVIADGLVSLMG